MSKLLFKAQFSSQKTSPISTYRPIVISIPLKHVHKLVKIKGYGSGYGYGLRISPLLRINCTVFFFSSLAENCGVWRLENLGLQVAKPIPLGGPHLAESQAGSGWWRWPVPRRSPRPMGSCRAGTPRREGHTVGRSSRSKAWCTGLCQQAGPSRPQLAWCLPWKPKHPAQQEQQLPSHDSAWAGWRQATPSASTAAKLQHPGTRSTSKFVLHTYREWASRVAVLSWICKAIYKIEKTLQKISTISKR